MGTAFLITAVLIAGFTIGWAFWQWLTDELHWFWPIAIAEAIEEHRQEQKEKHRKAEEQEALKKKAGTIRIVGKIDPSTEKNYFVAEKLRLGSEYFEEETYGWDKLCDTLIIGESEPMVGGTIWETRSRLPYSSMIFSYIPIQFETPEEAQKAANEYEEQQRKAKEAFDLREEKKNYSKVIGEFRVK